jgi:hypothetical protein
MSSTRPARGDAADYYFTYIDLVPSDDIHNALEVQQTETLALLKGISEVESLKRYAPEKWTIRQVVSHINDTERAFAFRALWFARGFDSPLMGFDQNIAVEGADANSRSWASHVEEFSTVREATLSLFRSLSPEALTRRGIASGNPVTVRAVEFITAGHVAHHLRILKERYL